MKNKKIFPNLVYKTMSSNVLPSNLLETKIYSNSSIGSLDLKCMLLDVYNIKSPYISSNIIKRGKKNIKIN